MLRGFWSQEILNVMENGPNPPRDSYGGSIPYAFPKRASQKPLGGETHASQKMVGSFIDAKTVKPWYLGRLR